MTQSPYIVAFLTIGLLLGCASKQQAGNIEPLQLQGGREYASKADLEELSTMIMALNDGAGSASSYFNKKVAIGSGLQALLANNNQAMAKPEDEMKALQSKGLPSDVKAFTGVIASEFIESQGHWIATQFCGGTIRAATVGERQRYVHRTPFAIANESMAVIEKNNRILIVLFNRGYASWWDIL